MGGLGGWEVVGRVSMEIEEIIWNYCLAKFGSGDRKG